MQRRLDAEADAASAAAGDDEAAAPDPDLERMLREIAARRLDTLDSLPPDVGARIRRLQDYDFMDGDARQRFEDLVDRLRGSVLDRLSEGLADAVKHMRPEDLAAQRSMVQDLNRLLARRLSGDEPSRGDVDEFLARHGEFFPGAATLDDVVDQLADRMAAMQSLMRSLTPEQRAELQDTIDALLQDDRLRWDLAQLAANLDQLLPDGLGDRVRFGGDQPLGLESALEQLGRLQALDRLEADLEGVGGDHDLADIDRGDVRELLGAGRGPRPRCARGPRAAPRAGRLPRPRGRPDGADAARQPADRAEGPRRPVRAAAQGRVRGPPARSDRARRRPRGDLEAVRVRGPVPPRPAGDDDERADARRERADHGGPRPRPSGSGPTTSRCSGPSARRRPRRCCWWT